MVTWGTIVCGHGRCGTLHCEGHPGVWLANKYIIINCCGVWLQCVWSMLKLACFVTGTLGFMEVQLLCRDASYCMVRILWSQGNDQQQLAGHRLPQVQNSMKKFMNIFVTINISLIPSLKTRLGNDQILYTYCHHLPQLLSICKYIKWSTIK